MAGTRVFLRAFTLASPDVEPVLKCDTGVRWWAGSHVSDKLPTLNGICIFTAVASV